MEFRGDKSVSGNGKIVPASLYCEQQCETKTIGSQLIWRVLCTSEFEVTAFPLQVGKAIYLCNIPAYTSVLVVYIFSP